MALTMRADPAEAGGGAAGRKTAGAGDLHWREMIGQAGIEVALPLSSALERVTQLATTGTIDRAGLRALREEIERARRTGLVVQQLARFASGRIRQTPERLSLTQMLREVLVQRGREAGARNIAVGQALSPAEVMADATVLHALLQALLDWTLDTAQSRIDLRIDVKAWPPNASLTCAFDHATQESATTAAAHMPPPAVDSMAWRLVEQIAWSLGLVVDRQVRGTETLLKLEFPATVTDQIEGVSVVELDQDFGVSENSRPLAGSHVLIMVGDREVRRLIKESIRPMGLLVDFVGSVDEAVEFCRDAMPHAIVYESVLVNERFRRLRANLLAEMPTFVFIEIAAEGNAFELSAGASRPRARLGRDSIAQSLPTALIYELSRMP
jgi:hypothetical protein